MTTECFYALGLDTGTRATGIALVDDRDHVFAAEVLRPVRAHRALDRILWLYDMLSNLRTPVAHPLHVLAIEIYTPPAQQIHAVSSRIAAEHNWLIGACLTLMRSRTPAPFLALLEATDWQHAVTGIDRNKPIGGKGIVRQAVERRTGYRFASTVLQAHDSDAAGIALVGLDRWKHARLGLEA